MPVGPRRRGGNCSAATAATTGSSGRTTAATAAAATKRNHPQKKCVATSRTPVESPAGQSGVLAVKSAAAAQKVTNAAFRPLQLRQGGGPGSAHRVALKPAGHHLREAAAATAAEKRSASALPAKKTVASTTEETPPTDHLSSTSGGRSDVLFPRVRNTSSASERPPWENSQDKLTPKRAASFAENMDEDVAAPKNVSSSLIPQPMDTADLHSSSNSSLLGESSCGGSSESAAPRPAAITSSRGLRVSSVACPAGGTPESVLLGYSSATSSSSDGDAVLDGTAAASASAAAMGSSPPSCACAAAAASPAAPVAASAHDVVSRATAPVIVRSSAGPSSSFPVIGSKGYSQLSCCTGPSAAARAPCVSPAAAGVSVFRNHSGAAAADSQYRGGEAQHQPAAPFFGGTASHSDPPGVLAAASVFLHPPIAAADAPPLSSSCTSIDDMAPTAVLPADAADVSAAAAAAAASFAAVRHARLSNGSTCLNHLRWWLRRQLRLASSGLLHGSIMSHPHVLAAARIAPLQTIADHHAPSSTMAAAADGAAAGRGRGTAAQEPVEAPARTAGAASACSPQRESEGSFPNTSASGADAAASAAAAATTTAASGAAGAAAASPAFAPHSVEAVAVQLAHKLICCLLLKEKSSVLLLGPPGSGKTAAVALALRTVQQLAQQQRSQRLQEQQRQQVQQEQEVHQQEQEQEAHHHQHRRQEEPEQQEVHAVEVRPRTLRQEQQQQKQQEQGGPFTPSRCGEGSIQDSARGRGAASASAAVDTEAGAGAGAGASYAKRLCEKGPAGTVCRVLTEASPASPLRCAQPRGSAAAAVAGAAEPSSGAACGVAAVGGAAAAATATAAAGGRGAVRLRFRGGAGAAGRRAAARGRGAAAVAAVGGGSGGILSVTQQQQQQQQQLPDLLVVHVCCSLYPDETAMLHTIVQQLAQALHCQQQPSVSASFEELATMLRLILGDSCSVFGRAVVIVLDHFEACCCTARGGGAAAAAAAGGGGGVGLLAPTQLHAGGGSSRRQQLLYCLFDLQHSSKLQLCTVCVSSLLGIIDQMEKRIRSRFSLQTLYVAGSPGASQLLQFVRQQLLPLSAQQLLRVAADAAAAEQVYAEWLDPASAAAVDVAASMPAESEEARVKKQQQQEEKGRRAADEEEGGEEGGREGGDKQAADAAASDDDEEEEARVTPGSDQRQQSEGETETETEPEHSRSSDSAKRDALKGKKRSRGGRSEAEEAAAVAEAAGERGEQQTSIHLPETAAQGEIHRERGRRRRQAGKRRDCEAAAAAAGDEGTCYQMGAIAKKATHAQTTQTTAVDAVEPAGTAAVATEGAAAAAGGKEPEAGARGAQAGKRAETATVEAKTEATGAASEAGTAVAAEAQRGGEYGRRSTTASSGAPLKKKMRRQVASCGGGAAEQTRGAVAVSAVKQQQQISTEEGNAAVSKRRHALVCLSAPAAAAAVAVPGASRCCPTVEGASSRSSRWQPSAEDRATAQVFVAAYLAAVDEELSSPLFRMRFVRYFDMGRQPRFFFVRLIDRLLSIADGTSHVVSPLPAAVGAAVVHSAAAAAGTAPAAAPAGAATASAAALAVELRAAATAAVTCSSCDLEFPISGCRKTSHSAAAVGAASSSRSSPFLTPSRASYSAASLPSRAATASTAVQPSLVQHPLLQTTQQPQPTAEQQGQHQGHQQQGHQQQGHQQQGHQQKDDGDDWQAGAAAGWERNGDFQITPTKRSESRTSVASFFSPATVRSPLTFAAEDASSLQLQREHSPTLLEADENAAFERESRKSKRRSSSSSSSAAVAEAAATRHMETQLQALCGGGLLREESGIEMLLPQLSLTEHLILGAFTRLHEQRRFPKTLHLACEQLAQLFANPRAKQQQPHIAGLRRAFMRLLEMGLLRTCDIIAIHETAAFSAVAVAAADGLFSSCYLCYVPCKFPAYTKYREMLEMLRLPWEFKSWVSSLEFCN